MTASTPRRPRSPCQSGTASAPARRTARAASRSSSDPGKLTTPIRAVTGVLPRTQATGYRRGDGSAGVGEFAVGKFVAEPVRERGTRAPGQALVQGDDGPVLGPAGHAHVIDAGPHDVDPPPRLRQGGDVQFPGRLPGLRRRAGAGPA